MTITAKEISLNFILCGLAKAGFSMYTWYIDLTTICNARYLIEDHMTFAK